MKMHEETENVNGDGKSASQSPKCVLYMLLGLAVGINIFPGMLSLLILCKSHNVACKPGWTTTTITCHIYKMQQEYLSAFWCVRSSPCLLEATVMNNKKFHSDGAAYGCSSAVLISTVSDVIKSRSYICAAQ